MQVGCGKSSLIAAMLGQMTKRSGRVECVDSVAYVAQQAWIQNASVKNNVLFGQSMEWSRYNEIVRCRMRIAQRVVDRCVGVGMCFGC